MTTRSPFTNLLLSLVLVAAASGAYAYWYGVLSSASAEAADLTSRITGKSEDAARIAAAKTTLTMLAPQEESIRNYFIFTDDIVPFLERLEATGKSLGAEVSVVSVSAGTGPGHEHLLIAMKIVGTFDAVFRTLGAIEYGPRDIVMTNLALENVSKETTEWEAAVTFAIGTRISTRTATTTDP